MNKIFRTALVLAFFACASSLLIVTASAQSVYGSIFGTVSDKSGAVIPNATITVTDEAKGTVVTVTSNGAGDYSVPHLIPDVYDRESCGQGVQSLRDQGHQGRGRHRAAHRSYDGRRFRHRHNRRSERRRTA